MKHGDVLLFIGALAAVEVVFEKSPESVSGAVVRKVLGSLRGKGWRDGVGERRGREERRRMRELQGKASEEEIGERGRNGAVSGESTVDSSVNQTPAATDNEDEKKNA